MYELKPCPFCGADAEVIESEYGMYETGYAIYCTHCSLKLGVDGRLSEAYEWTPVFDTEAEAINAWNKRAERTCRYIKDPDTWAEICSECGAPAIEDWTADYCWACGAKVVG